MCILFFVLGGHPRFKFILASNRDEYYERFFFFLIFLPSCSQLNRPTAPAGFWEDEKTILAGRDLKRGGIGVLAIGIRIDRDL
jgi:uncharacterized protein with NRDE domain